MRIGEYLGMIDYPGRIILGGTGYDGEDIIMYAITGRSANSRNRLLALDGDTLRTIPADESRISDPSLIIYNAMKRAGDALVISNGSHTDAISSQLLAGRSLESAIASCAYEPDAPAYTPRIALVMERSVLRFALVARDAESGDSMRKVFSYEKESGICHVIHTYEGNGDPLPSFAGLPPRLDAEESAESLLHAVWHALDPDFRISVYLRYGAEEVLINGRGGTDA